MSCPINQTLPRLFEVHWGSLQEWLDASLFDVVRANGNRGLHLSMVRILLRQLVEQLKVLQAAVDQFGVWKVWVVQIRRFFGGSSLRSSSVESLESFDNRFGAKNLDQFLGVLMTFVGVPGSGLHAHRYQAQELLPCQHGDLNHFRVSWTQLRLRFLENQS